MSLLKQSQKRIGLYFFYDAQGVVDDYNIYLLNDLKKNLDKLLVVVNGLLTPEGRSKFESVCDEILVRENIGFDVWAYKEGIEHIGWDALGQYDELVMLNFTNFGPVYPFKEMFDEMAGRDVDFWGIVMRYGMPHDPYKMCKYGYIPDHVSSSFMVVRRDLLRSNDFKKYWEQMPMIHSYEESVCFHEAVFTEHFKRLGYVCDNYIHADDLKDQWDYVLMLFPYELVKNRRCPIFKRKTFYNNYEEYFMSCCGNPAYDLYNFLKNETNYDVNMIWDNLLRTVNLWDIKQRMQLEYILPDNIAKKKNAKGKTALAMHLYYEDKIDFCYKYAKNMPDDADVYITTNTEEKKEKILKKFQTLNYGKLTVQVIPNRGRDVSALLTGLAPYLKDYDYVCFVHDKKGVHTKPHIIGESFEYKCFENTLASKDYVKNVLFTFDENPKLGILAPPPPNHSHYYYTIGYEWGTNFETTCALAKDLGITVNMDKDKPPVAPLGTMFWFRPKALSILFDRQYTYEDYPAEPLEGSDGSMLHAIERLYPFAAQQKGYYSAWMLSTTFAKFETTNLYYMLHDIHKAFIWHHGINGRQNMLYIIGQPPQGVSVNPDQKNPYTDDRYALTTWAIIKLLARRVLGNNMYDKLVKMRNKIRYRVKKK
jgi:lipopolysaccharide biosynthesis protein